MRTGLKYRYGIIRPYNYPFCLWVTGKTKQRLCDFSDVRDSIVRRHGKEETADEKKY